MDGGAKTQWALLRLNCLKNEKRSIRRRRSRGKIRKILHGKYLKMLVINPSLRCTVDIKHVLSLGVHMKMEGPEIHPPGSFTSEGSSQKSPACAVLQVLCTPGLRLCPLNSPPFLLLRVLKTKLYQQTFFLMSQMLCSLKGAARNE